MSPKAIGVAATLALSSNIILATDPGQPPPPPSEPEIIVVEEAQRFEGTAQIATVSSNDVVVRLDQAPADGTIDFEWIFTSIAPFSDAISRADVSVVLDYWNLTLGRVVLDDLEGQLHLDLAVSYLNVRQPPGSAVANVVARGSYLSFRATHTVNGITESNRTDVALSPDLGLSRVQSGATYSDNGAMATSSGVGLRLPDDAGVDSPVPLDSEDVFRFTLTSQHAYQRGLGNVGELGCYETCMDDESCDFVSILLAGTTNYLVVKLTAKNGWIITATAAGALACHGANSIGCRIVCAAPVEPGPCVTGSMCKPSCGFFEHPTGTCPSGPDVWVCCETTTPPWGY